jgi:hypothetical protein
MFAGTFDTFLPKVPEPLRTAVFPEKEAISAYKFTSIFAPETEVLTGG